MTVDEAIQLWNHRRENPKADRTPEEIAQDRKAGSVLYGAGLIAYAGGWVVTVQGRQAGVR